MLHWGSTGKMLRPQRSLSVTKCHYHQFMSHAVAMGLHHIIPGCITYCLGPRHSKLHITCKPHLLWEQVATKLMGKEVHVLVVCTNDRLERQKRVTAHHPTRILSCDKTLFTVHTHILYIVHPISIVHADAWVMYSITMATHFVLTVSFLLLS